MEGEKALNESYEHSYRLDNNISDCKLRKFEVLIEGLAWARKMNTTISETHEKVSMNDEFITL